MIMTQTGALFLDAYRELNAKKMFWVVLGLTLLVLAGFATLGVNSEGISFLWYHVRAPAALASYYYKQWFSNLVVGVWFTWVATILALISTAGIFPDFLSAGSVDLYLARPISRLRLFLTKFAAGLLFVTLQVTLFTVASFFVLGIRGGLWQPGLFLAIPIVVLFFSYLYAICVLLGILTRSTVAALLLTILAWLGIWGLDVADRVVVAVVNQASSRHEELGQRIELIDKRIAATQAATDPATMAAAATEMDAPTDRDPFGRRNGPVNLQTTRAELVRERDAYELGQVWYTMESVMVGVKSFVPKTRETLNLLDRVLFTDKELQDASRQEEQPQAGEAAPRRRGRGGERWIDPTRSRPVWWVVGTSLMFELVVLGAAGWVFVRRDY
jgi:ABC-type transport system involved in multi-copper enzyme maturation permease subunit